MIPFQLFIYLFIFWPNSFLLIKNWLVTFPLLGEHTKQIGLDLIILSGGGGIKKQKQKQDISLGDFVFDICYVI